MNEEEEDQAEMEMEKSFWPAMLEGVTRLLDLDVTGSSIIQYIIYVCSIHSLAN